MRARLFGLLFLAFCSSTSSATDLEEITATQWREDIEALVDGIEHNHRDPYNFISPEKLRSLASEARRQAARAEPHEMVVAMQRIAAAFGDGHTFLAASGVFTRYPIEMEWIEGGFYVARATPPHASLLGSRLVAIDDTPINVAARELLALVPRNENRWYERAKNAELLNHAEALAAFGVTGNSAGAIFAFEMPDGHRERLHFAAGKNTGHSDFMKIGGKGEPMAATPENGFRLGYFADVAYIDFAGYGDLASSSERVWSSIDTERPRALIIDFRRNGGGSLVEGRRHVVYPTWARSQLNYAGCLFVLIGPDTFSAAMTNVTDLRRETEAFLIGLPTGARPNGYQENSWFTLPNSRLRVSVATRRYRFGSPGDDAVVPDLLVTETVEDLRRGRDAALIAALSRARECRRRSETHRSEWK
jgi:hypothetical protein